MVCGQMQEEHLSPGGEAVEGHWQAGTLYGVRVDMLESTIRMYMCCAVEAGAPSAGWYSRLPPKLRSWGKSCRNPHLPTPYSAAGRLCTYSVRTWGQVHLA